MVKKDNLLDKAKNIKLIAMDIDGVLTSGEIIILDSGEEIKIWNVKDGFAFHLAQRNGIDLKFAWITGRRSKQIEKRAMESKIDILHQGCMQKKEALEIITRELSVSPNEIIFIGDDLVDIPALRYVGFSICPNDAPKEVKNEVDYITNASGGKGVIREVVELVLKAQNVWNEAVNGYL